jgi:hypothetical protein
MPEEWTFRWSRIGFVIRKRSVYPQENDLESTNMFKMPRIAGSDGDPSSVFFPTVF